MVVSRSSWAFIWAMLVCGLHGVESTQRDFCLEYRLKHDNVHYCLNGGTCLNKENGTECSCLPGYTGVQCKDDVKECALAEGVCFNGATCVDKLGTYECYCTHGFTGKHCEINIDDCVDHNCHPSAICVDQVDGYTCECPPGRYGAECEKENLCYTQNPCFHGNCTMLNNGDYHCECATGYTGENCDVDVNECDWSPCRNGRCENTYGSYKCHCDTGFTGPHCEDLVEHCTGDPCQNAGTCLNRYDGYTCLCMPGFTGPDCETRLDTSCSLECQHGGVCYMGNSCSCPPAFEGKLCEIPKPDPCKKNLCGKNGWCAQTSDYTDYYCECYKGYRGDYCQIKECVQGDCVMAIDYCTIDNVSCNGHGRCVNLDDRAHCRCDKEHSGDRCEFSLHAEDDADVQSSVHLFLIGPRRSVIGQLDYLLRALGNTLHVSIRVYLDDQNRPKVYAWNKNDGTGPIIDTSNVIDVSDDSIVYRPNHRYSLPKHPASSSSINAFPHAIDSNSSSCSGASEETANEGFLLQLRIDIQPCLDKQRLDPTITCPSDIAHVTGELVKSSATDEVLRPLCIVVDAAKTDEEPPRSNFYYVVMGVVSVFLILLLVFSILTIKKRKPTYRDRNIVVATTYHPQKSSDQANSLYASTPSLNGPQYPVSWA